MVNNYSSTRNGPCKGKASQLSIEPEPPPPQAGAPRLDDGGERPSITWIFFFRPHLDYPPYRRPLCSNDDVDEYETIEK